MVILLAKFEKLIARTEIKNKKKDESAFYNYL